MSTDRQVTFCFLGRIDTDACRSHISLLLKELNINNCSIVRMKHQFGIPRNRMVPNAVATMGTPNIMFKISFILPLDSCLPSRVKTTAIQIIELTAAILKRIRMNEINFVFVGDDAVVEGFSWRTTCTIAVCGWNECEHTYHIIPIPWPCQLLTITATDPIRAFSSPWPRTPHSTFLPSSPVATAPCSMRIRVAIGMFPSWTLAEALCVFWAKSSILFLSGRTFYHQFGFRSSL